MLSVRRATIHRVPSKFLQACCTFVICAMLGAGSVWLGYATSGSLGDELSQKDLIPMGEAGETCEPVNCSPCPSEAPSPEPTTSLGPPTPGTHSINCTIYGEDKLIDCRREGDEVYMPVSFINQFFDVYGAMRRLDGEHVYQFKYAYANLYPIQDVYHPGGVFLNFDRYWVAERAAISCVTATDGIPLNTQWSPLGYYYAISVAQYGLSHHARGLLNGNPVPKDVANGRLGARDWNVSGAGQGISVTNLDVNGSSVKVLAFTASESMLESGPTLAIGTSEQSFCFKILMLGPGGVTVKIETKSEQTGYVHFCSGNEYIRIQDNHIFYGMGEKNRGKWVHLARDLKVDWLKTSGPAISYRSPNAFSRIIDVTVHGKGYLDNVTVSVSAHFQHLIHAADWLVNSQDKVGGWPTPVGVRTGEIELQPGWYSAMAQGQAMSTLVRAYNITGQKHYLDVAAKGLHLYQLGSEEGGVRARFLGLLDWYEEYPTTPTSTFVLNGFIFSMLGLYDAMKTLTGENQAVAERLWNAGLRSLKLMLGMYDSGTGTLYDLRHVISHEQPNRARWDYHTTHISLIQEMALIDGDPIFYEAANRWTDYLKGKRSKHN